MKVPLLARIGALILASTGFYTYVGQMVPQKMVLPPEETVLNTEMTTDDMVKVGRQIFEGKGLCVTCHTLGKTGALRFPDLAGVAGRAKTREPGLSDIDYFAQAMYEPNSFIVPGFNPGMPEINKPPIGLSDQEILTLIAYLQSLGGTPSVTLKTSHRYYNPGAPTGAAPTPGSVPPGGAVAAPGGPVAAPGRGGR
jgi:mono/diheme cytochrome c family protein